MFYTPEYSLSWCTFHVNVSLLLWNWIFQTSQCDQVGWWCSILSLISLPAWSIGDWQGTLKSPTVEETCSFSLLVLSGFIYFFKVISTLKPGLELTTLKWRVAHSSEPCRHPNFALFLKLFCEVYTQVGLVCFLTKLIPLSSCCTSLYLWSVSTFWSLLCQKLM